jgi:AAA+ superfamily predicted ATPase
MDKQQELYLLINSESPLIYVETWEEERIERMLEAIATQLEIPLFTWTATTGLQRAGLPNVVFNTAEPMAALNHIGSICVDALYLMKDFHRYLEQDLVLRKLRDICQLFRQNRRSLLISAPALEIPLELRKDVVAFRMGLPDRAQLRQFAAATAQRIAATHRLRNSLNGAGFDQLAAALCGLTLNEAERVLAKSMIEYGGLDERCLDEVLLRKKEAVAQQGILEFVEPSESFQDVGGLANLKQWLQKRQGAYSAETAKFGLEPPRGILIMGVQGCGKSLCAKAVAREWRMPLLKMDAGNLYDKYVGETERRLREALETSAQLAPAVLWIDEIEKGFATSPGTASVDGGVSNRILGSFLSWLQERQQPVFVVATCNDITALPPELVRKGRFDEIFFVDLPGPEERKEIFRVHLARKGRDPNAFALEALAANSEGFSGAEIEQAVKAGLYTAFPQKREVTTEILVAELHNSVPLSTTRREEVEALRSWAAGRALRANDGGRPADTQP